MKKQKIQEQIIDSSQLITHHTLNITKPDQLLVCYTKDHESTYGLIADDDTFPNNKVPLTTPQIFSLLSMPFVVGCSNGLVGLVSEYPTNPQYKWEFFVLWNPAISKSVEIMVTSGFTAIGFGVCRETADLKVVRCTDAGEAEVFNLRTKTSRTVSMNLSVPLRKNYRPSVKHVVINGVVYWTDYEEDTLIHRIVSFDLTTEEFEEVYLPDDFDYDDVSIVSFNDSVAVMNYNNEVPECHVWKMIKGDNSSCSLTKAYFVSLLGDKFLADFDIVGFRKSGELITRRIPTRDHSRNHEVNERCIDDLGFDSSSFSKLVMMPYKESLLLQKYADHAIIEFAKADKCQQVV